MIKTLEDLKGKIFLTVAPPFIPTAEFDEETKETSTQMELDNMTVELF